MMTDTCLYFHATMTDTCLYFLVCKGSSNDDVGVSGWQEAPFFRRYGGELDKKKRRFS